MFTKKPNKPPEYICDGPHCLESTDNRFDFTRLVIGSDVEVQYTAHWCPACTVMLVANLKAWAYINPGNPISALDKL